jgi:hypothetical protein
MKTYRTYGMAALLGRLKRSFEDDDEHEDEER